MARVCTRALANAEALRFMLDLASTVVPSEWLDWGGETYTFKSFLFSSCVYYVVCVCME